MNHSQLWTAFYTILSKEIRRFIRIWPQTLLPPAITMSLYFMIFGQIIGAKVGQIDGLSYMQFIVPGLVMMAVITNSYSNVCSSFFGAKFHRSIEELLTSPTPIYIIIFGFVMGGVARGILVGIIVTLLSLFFTHLDVVNLFVIIYTIVITSMLFSLGGLINAIYAKSFDDISIIPNFVLTPLTYLGGVFYSINSLSEFWQNVSLLNPIVYMVNSFRYGILGHSDVNIYLSLTTLSAACFLLYAIVYYLLYTGKGLRA